MQKKIMDFEHPTKFFSLHIYLTKLLDFTIFYEIFSEALPLIALTGRGIAQKCVSVPFLMFGIFSYSA